jgi:hypothetical protein
MKKNGFIAYLEQVAPTVNSKPTLIIKKSGFSDANWYNWKNGVNSPSAEMQEKIKQTIEAMKPQAEVKQETATPSVVNYHKLLDEKREEAKKLSQVIGALEIITQNI